MSTNIFRLRFFYSSSETSKKSIVMKLLSLPAKKAFSCPQGVLLCQYIQQKALALETSFSSQLGGLVELAEVLFYSARRKLLTLLNYLGNRKCRF